jgi:hypothetical protein
VQNERQNRPDDDDQAHQINDVVHGAFPPIFVKEMAKSDHGSVMAARTAALRITIESSEPE